MQPIVDDQHRARLGRKAHRTRRFEIGLGRDHSSAVIVDEKYPVGAFVEIGHLRRRALHHTRIDRAQLRSVLDIEADGRIVLPIHSPVYGERQRLASIGQCLGDAAEMAMGRTIRVLPEHAQVGTFRIRRANKIRGTFKSLSTAVLDEGRRRTQKHQSDACEHCQERPGWACLKKYHARSSWLGPLAGPEGVKAGFSIKSAVQRTADSI
jgi:hypothetical protein